jgi:hypothetical protein
VERLEKSLRERVRYLCDFVAAGAGGQMAR